MRESEFKRLKTFDDDDESKINELKVGDNFLFGRTYIMQRENKTVGDAITYYQILNKSKISVEYMPIYDYMENDNITKENNNGK